MFYSTGSSQSDGETGVAASDSPAAEEQLVSDAAGSSGASPAGGGGSSNSSGVGTAAATASAQAGGGPPSPAAAAADAAARGGARLHPLSARIAALPLWRIEAAAFPCSQAILHVHKLHYLHLFDQVLAGPKPWLFGHLYLPGGSSNLGAADYELRGGSRAPLVGTLMEVTRAARLMDGKLLILATAVARFRVVEARRELPYSVADVEVLHDAEELEAVQQAALDAAVQVRGD
jgi:hypothetical protein